MVSANSIRHLLPDGSEMSVVGLGPWLHVWSNDDGVTAIGEDGKDAAGSEYIA